VETYQSLQQIVERRLRRDIIHGIYRPGTRLIERTLSERYETSHGPVREAIRALEAQGLVVREPHKGVRVADLSVSEMAEIYEMRILLEGLAAGKATSRAKPFHRDFVRHRYEELTATAVDDPAWLDRNNAFHLALYQTTCGPILVEAIHGLMQRIEPHIRLYLEISAHFAATVSEHEEIWRSFNEGDASECERLTKQHLANANSILATMLGGLCPEAVSGDDEGPTPSSTI
jgi:DNA-binding GntR family transcriptional regulator